MVFHSNEHAMIEINIIEMDDVNENQLAEHFNNFKVIGNLNCERRGHEIENGKYLDEKENPH